MARCLKHAPIGVLNKLCTDISNYVSFVQIKQAFKRLSLEHHPDRVPPENRKSAEAHVRSGVSCCRVPLVTERQFVARKQEPVAARVVWCLRLGHDTICDG